MAVNRMGKPAVTRYEVLERFGVHTYLRCVLETGRTHQIRVHMQHLQAPIVGDPVYGIRGIIPHRFMTDVLSEAVQGFKRQALHAIRLGLIHPASGEPMEWQIDLPADMRILLEAMRHEDPVTDEAFEFEMQDEDDYDDEAFDSDMGDDMDEDDDLE